MAYIASLANWDALLQEDYVTDGIRDAVNSATPFMDVLERSGTTDTSGRERVAAVQVGMSQGQGARAENAQMPGYGAGVYRNCITRCFYNYAPFKITGQSEEFGTNKAFVDFAMRILKDTKAGFRLFTGRQCWGDGQGILALINGALLAGVMTAQVDSPYGVLWGSLSTATTVLLKNNMPIQFGSEDNNNQGYTVTFSGGTTLNFTPGLLANVADNTPITNKGSANLEFEGILKFAGTAAFMTTLGVGTIYHNIDRAAFPEWEGNVLNVAGALSLTALRALRSAIYKRTNDDESNILIGSTEFYDAYEALLMPTTYRTVNTLELKAGNTSLTFDDLRLKRDSLAPTRAFFLAHSQSLEWVQTRDPHWYQDGNGQITRIIPGFDAKEALLKWYSNIDCKEPRRFGIGYNLTMS